MQKGNAMPAIGIALGGGGAKGWSHIGVLNALEHLGIRPSIIAGTSMGALVGAAYASNRLKKLEAWARPMSWTDVIGYLDPSLSGGGFIQGEKLLEAMQRKAFKNMPIDQLPKPFGAVATQLHTGQEVWLKDGSLMDAVRASIALPGLFTPVVQQGKWLVDGGLVNPVPVSLCRALGADIVIAVNLSADLNRRHAYHTYIENTEPESNDADMLPSREDLTTEELNLWDKVSNQVVNGFQEGKEALLAKMILRNKDMPGLFEVFSKTINIMQDRITRSRMAGDPPDVSLSPRVGDISTIEFHKAKQAIRAGEECVYRMRPVLEDIPVER